MFEFRLPKELRKRKMKLKSQEDIEPQQILLDSLAQKKEKEIGISEKRFEVPLSKKILQGLLVIFFILILALFGKTFQLQVFKGKELSALSQENKFIVSAIRAERGVIYDNNMNQLVFNQPAFDLICFKTNLPQKAEERLKVLKGISEITNKSFEDLKKEIEESDFSQVLISENLDYKTLILLETKIRELPGFQIVNNTAREYKNSENFAHLLGYTAKIKVEELKAAPNFYSITDYVGRAGLEKSYEEILRKNPGKLRIERDALGNPISKEMISLPESGKSLILWLDSDLQKKIIEELKKELLVVGSKKAVAVALNPKTGGVLALISLPGFDNNSFQKGSDPSALENLLVDPQDPLFNRVISGTYPIGSTIKPLMASAALEEKIIQPDKKINCQGGIQIKHRYIPEIVYEFQDWKTHGWTDMRKAIAESCNVYFYTIGGGYEDQEGLGPSRIKRYLSLFGWGKATGIDLPGETTGFIPDPSWKETTKKEGWWDGDTYNLSIGQGDILITPLQVATAFSVIANGGKLLQPQIVQKIIDSEKNLIKEFEPKIIRENFIDPKNLQIVREGMRMAVTYGSSVILNSLPVKAGAKTGTAQTSRKGYYHNWVTVFAPYEDPQIVLTIVIEDVEGMQAAALPVAKGVLDWYFSNEK